MSQINRECLLIWSIRLSENTYSILLTSKRKEKGIKRAQSSYSEESAALVGDYRRLDGLVFLGLPLPGIQVYCLVKFLYNAISPFL